jgi:hypothetical protein
MEHLARSAEARSVLVEKGDYCRISGTAAITSNGSLAGFSGSPVDIEISGGSALPFANITVTFGGSAAAHFGAAPVHGVVNVSR